MRRTALFLLLSGMVFSCSTAKKQFSAHVQVVEEGMPGQTSPIPFSPGIPVYDAAAVSYNRDNKSVFNIQFNQPVIISVADKPQPWGFFQFPHIGTRPDGSLQVKWNMKADAMSAYGMEGSGAAISADGGKTWQLQKHTETTGDVLLPNGDRLEIATPKPIDTKNLKMPKPVLTSAQGNTYTKETSSYYRLNDLPADCQAVYLKRLKKGETEWKDEKATLADPNAARHTTAGLLPVIWWGDMHVAADGSLIAGVYPGTLVNDEGKLVPKSNVFFYRSTDNGHSWNIQGRLMYQADILADAKGNKRMGFTEPAFEILPDGTFICVSRTTDGNGNGPMYAAYSKDWGKTWTTPKAFSANGVLPQLLQLKNGILVLSSGRPGVQLRFAADGKTWSDAFEMLPYATEKDQVSCGYTGLIAINSDTFLVVYSDFNFKNASDEVRKAIKIRQITIDPASSRRAHIPKESIINPN
ncbi:exo-alpha-sialidase [Mucilaginibacter mali]|uniref:Exo-alpha-sialidase n=1 Tax=Mucilaginibacter mali TaxID=2740462 RepID=A0A7D4QFI3_9SPHI|nr:sialidase family protein [Mucilaginibacter mali]QKJ32624.1 exo-alpha-sialidase [Mucilaginibacter mali]